MQSTEFLFWSLAYAVVVLLPCWLAGSAADIGAGGSIAEPTGDAD